MSRVLVTGGDGFLGRHVVPRLKLAGHDVDAPPHGEVDLTEPEEAAGMIDGAAPDAVVHLAALCGGIGLNQARPADLLRDNARMGLNVLDACAAAGVGRVVMLGTTCSYPRDCPTPFKEDDFWNGYPEATNAPYGVAKRLLLTAALAYRQQLGLDAVTLVPTNLYGPHDHFGPDRSHVIPAMIVKICQARDARLGEVDLWGDGSPTRDFLYVEDCAAAVVRAVAEPDLGPEPINLGSGVEVSMLALAEEIADLVGWGGRLRWDATKPNGQPRRRLDAQRAALRLGWRAETALRDGLRVTVRWFQETGGRP